jgi:hypothetical protein
MIKDIKDNEIVGEPIKDGRYRLLKPESQRSLQLNKYYWGVVIKIFAGELGWSDQDAHDYFKCLFLKNAKVLTFGFMSNSDPIQQVINPIKSTSDLSSAEFIDYIKKIQQFSAEQGIVIPDPNESDYDKIYKMYKRD